MAEPKADPKYPSSSEEKDLKAAPNAMERESEAMTRSEKSPYDLQETHGRSDAIDKDTPIDEVKGPGVFGRVKEEIEALVGTICSNKDKSDQSSS
ncbi:Dead-box atp-dependent rna helicase [Salix suchowensis]|nr:Dead-box atp-dependent rna helicase [Salix suchowensis]